MKLEWENGLHLFREDLTSHACDYFHASQNIDVFMIVSAEPIRESHQNSVATRGLVALSIIVMAELRLEKARFRDRFDFPFIDVTINFYTHSGKIVSILNPDER